MQRTGVKMDDSVFATKLLHAGCPLSIVSAHNFGRWCQAREIECRKLTPDELVRRLMMEAELS